VNNVGGQIQRQLQALRVEIRAAERRSALDTLSVAERLSSGQVSTRQLRRAGHPYARRHGTPLLNPAIINDQGGPFARSWLLRDPQSENGEETTAIVNTDPVGDYLASGTKVMFARPLPDAVVKEVKPRREERVRRAIEKAFKKQ
jgi:hypothetical protein